MYFLTGDNDLLGKYNTKWDKFSADIKKEFDREPVYNKEFLKTKKKLRFYSQKRWKLLSTSLLKECKYIEKKVVRHIYNNLSYFSSSIESVEE